MAETRTITARLPLEIIDHLDELRAQKQRKTTGGKAVTRTEILVDLVTKSADAATTITEPPEWHKEEKAADEGPKQE